MVEPVIVIGKNGMTPQVLDEIRKQLKLHETVKVRFPPMLATGRAKKAFAADLAGKVGAELEKTIGFVAVLMRKDYIRR